MTLKYLIFLLILIISSNFVLSDDFQKVKLISKEDALTKVDGSSIIGKNGAFTNASLNSIHLFHKGIQEYLYIESTDELFSNDDVVYFIGAHPQGDTTWLDNYTNDETFFLVVNPSLTPMNYSKFPTVTNTSGNIDKVNVFSHFEKETFYYGGYLELEIETEVVAGERWLWKSITPYYQSVFYDTLFINKLSNNEQSIEINIILESYKYNSEKNKMHRFELLINNNSVYQGQLAIQEYGNFKIEVPKEYLNDGINYLELVNLANVDEATKDSIKPDEIALDYYTLSYKTLPFINQGRGEFTIESLTSDKLIELDKNSNEPVIIFDKINNYYYFDKSNGSSISFGLQSGKNYSFVIGQNSALQIAEVKSVNNLDLKNPENQADALILYHKNFSEAALRLLELRKQTHPHYIVKAIDIEDVYDEFAYGKKSAHSIRNFLKYIYENWKKPSIKFVTLFGDASWDCRGILPNPVNLDYIPAYGWPVSDYWYSRMKDTSFYPYFVVSRIPVQTSEQANNYVNKVIEYENAEPHPYQKKFLFLSGGHYDSERKIFRNLIEQFANLIYNTNLCADTFLISKKDPTIGGEAEGSQIRNQINSGYAWTSFLGHGSPTVVDMDGWQVDRLKNKGKYGFLTTLSCNMAAYGEPYLSSRDEDYTIYPDKGFIVTAGSSSFGNADIGSFYQARLIYALTDTSIKYRTLGELLNLVKIQCGFWNIDTMYLWTAMQYTLLGDAMVSLKIDTLPDFTFLKSEIKIRNNKNDEILQENDGIAVIDGKIMNTGFRYEQPIQILLVREYENKNDSVYYTFNDQCLNSYFLFNLDILGKPGIHNIKIIIDPYSLSTERKYSNNIYTTSFEVFSQKLLPLEPLAYWNIEGENPEFRVINPIGSDSVQKYNFSILKQSDKNITTLVYASKENEIIVKENYIQWFPDVNLTQNAGYVLSADYILKNGKQSATTNIPFNIWNIEKNNALWRNITKEELTDNEMNNLEVKDSGVISIINNRKSFKVIGSTADDTTHYKTCLIMFDSIVYIETKSLSNYPQGFNILVVDAITGNYRLQHTYDSWNDTFATEKLVKLLRDSVTINDYVLIATCGQAFRMPQMLKDMKSKSVGHIDTLKKVLGEFGSAIADSLRYANTFVMLGKKGWEKGMAIENRDPDTIRGRKREIEGTLTFYNLFGKLNTNYFGPAKKWNQFSTSSTLKTGDTLKTEIWGLNRMTQTEALLISTVSTNIIDLNSIDANIYSNLKAVFYLSRTDILSEPNISAFSCDFVPADEFAAVKSKTLTKPDTLLRGETAEFSAAFENISKRNQSDTNTINCNIYSEYGTIMQRYFGLNDIPPDEEYKIEHSAETDDFSNNTTIEYTINKNQENVELYSFNNKAASSVVIFEDSLKPWVKIYFDGKEVKDNDYVAKQPFVEVELYDASPLKIDKDSKLLVRLNVDIQTSGNTQSYSFTSYGKNIPKKALLTFIPDSLDYKKNIINIYAIDATGNRDTLTLSVYVAQNGLIENLYNYPNPVELNQTTFSFDCISPIQSGTAHIDIFNLTGQKVNSLSKQVRIGNNTVQWNCTDANNNSLPTGMYYYRIYIESSIYFDAKTGVMEIIR